MLLPAAGLAADRETAAWQKGRPEARARSGNPRLNWRELAGPGKAGPASAVPAKPQRQARAAEPAPVESKKVQRHVVPSPAPQDLGKPRIKLRAVATRKDDQVEPAGAPLLRSALQPRAPSSVLEEDAAEEGRSYDELPSQDDPAEVETEMPDDSAVEPAPLDNNLESSPLDMEDSTDDEDLDAPPRKPGLLPEPAAPAKRKAADCDAECPSLRDPSLYRELMQISLGIQDPTQDLDKAPSDYVDADGLEPDDPVFQRGEKFVPRPSFRRCWIDADGTQFQGWFVKHKDGQVLVIDEDKNEHWIPVGKLSFRDRRYLNHLPLECQLDDEQYVPRAWCLTNFTWTASSLCHKPLYFEQVNYERYGHTWGPVVDPVLQGAHFFTSIAFLPYKMGIEPPQECIYPLGYYRPNSCAPYMLFPIPLSPRGALFQAGAVTGVAWLFH